MLEDFIEVNALKARLLDYKKINEDSANCELFIPEKGNPFLVVKLLRDKIDILKLSKIVGTKFRAANHKQCEHITGYKIDYLPPISIYGIRLVLDEKAAKHKKLFFQVSEDKTLEITPQEILGANENAIISNLSK